MDHPNDNFFQVSVKGLFFNDEHKLMLLQEKDGKWELPGGRVQKGEDLIDGLRRECLEETGITCEVLDIQPSIVYSAVDKENRGRIMVCYRISLPHLDFKPSEECVDIQFFRKDEIEKLPKPPQLDMLAQLL